VIITSFQIQNRRDTKTLTSTMGNIFPIVKINMSVEPEVLITSLLQQIEKMFQSRNQVKTHTQAALTRPQTTTSDNIFCQVSKMADDK